MKLSGCAERFLVMLWPLLLTTAMAATPTGPHSPVPTINMIPSNSTLVTVTRTHCRNSTTRGYALGTGFPNVKNMTCSGCNCTTPTSGNVTLSWLPTVVPTPATPTPTQPLPEGKPSWWNEQILGINKAGFISMVIVLGLLLLSSVIIGYHHWKSLQKRAELPPTARIGGE
ncbi:hypothetical protein QBC34DRAFT_440382 [Podospora aff. communis PSN243]|uniref:Uncharacterized protein n=1 Tax=Podospora aff. communis PSN243 TaxID=3040156 RepID=A0AAV9GIF5_9PEZI|nr:hypothetical protein QBC34DRAFT_440382 [Podospora aff. communis PSN243]